MMTSVIRQASRTALLGLLALSACLKDESSGSASQTGIGAASPLVWVDQSGISSGVAGDTPPNWIDATTVTPSGGGAILPSTDEITYGFPTPFLPVGDPSLTHQLQTNSSAQAVVVPEDQLAQAINTYRQVSAGFGGVGGIGGIGGIGGGGQQQQFATVLLPMANKSRKNARAHCKHYGTIANNHTGALPAGANAEGDNLIGGGAAPGGRFPKCNASAGQAAQVAVSGPTYGTATAARDYFVNNNAGVITSANYNYMGVGHWPAGSEQYYWNVIFTFGLNPQN